MNTETVPRTALIKKMKKLSARKNIFLTAPGGYGKTIAAAQWLSSVSGKTAKLTARDSDNDPGAFYKRFATALLKLTGQDEEIPKTEISFDRLLEKIRLMPEKNTRRYLVLDDLHIIKNEEILNNMPVITARLPDYICRCLVSRAEPAAAIVDSGLFAIITKDDLLFSPAEVEWFGAEKEINLTKRQIKELLETTGGWAMHLSALLSDDKALYERLEGKLPQTLTQYLRERVWGLWDDETKSLLLRLAMPTEVTPSLCERLTEQPHGHDVLERLTQKENAFLSHTGGDTYRFHDIFRDFLLQRISSLGENEIQRLNAAAARWYYEQGDFYAGAKHYIQNNDHEGINLCLAGPYSFHEKTALLSVEVRLNFTKQHISGLSQEFINENPYIISRCAVAAFYDGNAEDFFKYIDMLRRLMPEIAAKYPDLAETAKFSFGLDFRVPMVEVTRRIAEQAARSATQKPDTPSKSNARVNSITQNLPFYHRSQRDYSEYYKLGDELTLFKNTYGAAIGRDYTVMETSIYAGIYYERGELVEALHHAMVGWRACENDMHPETVFCAHMILSAVLYAMGALRDADRIMEHMRDFIERKAQYLYPNFKAVQTERAFRAGDTDAAREWLTVYANRSGRLPFYQICRHFTTLRAFIALQDYTAAAFGERLQALAAEYNRPLDRIESGLLVAIALWQSNENDKALWQLEQAAGIAMSYNFTQLFINEGNALLPLIFELRERASNSALAHFVDGVALEIYETLSKTTNWKYKTKTASEKLPKLTERQNEILMYLNDGMTYREIADVTKTAHSAAKASVLRMYKRLGVNNATEALAKARMLGMLED
ncbi:MAG: LuxR C-terminal-related transcriptional regulator [Defluviitaleaceae bacterium]|nr:LuxR C-terminal-related transcriptional regulator [Defluviitaleaceae bacterium]